MRALSYYILLYRVNCCLLEAYSFLKRGGVGVDVGDGEELGGEERGNCGLVVYNREEFIFNKKTMIQKYMCRLVTSLLEMHM